MGSSDFLIIEFKYAIIKKFEISYMSLLHYFLELEVRQGADGTFISQGNMQWIFSRDLV